MSPHKGDPKKVRLVMVKKDYGVDQFQHTPSEHFRTLVSALKPEKVSNKNNIKCLIQNIF